MPSRASPWMPTGARSLWTSGPSSFERCAWSRPRRRGSSCSPNRMFIRDGTGAAPPPANPTSWWTSGDPVPRSSVSGRGPLMTGARTPFAALAAIVMALLASPALGQDPGTRDQLAAVIGHAMDLQSEADALMLSEAPSDAVQRLRGEEGEPTDAAERYLLALAVAALSHDRATTLELASRPPDLRMADPDRLVGALVVLARHGGAMLIDPLMDATLAAGLTAAGGDGSLDGLLAVDASTEIESPWTGPALWVMAYMHFAAGDPDGGLTLIEATLGAMREELTGTYGLAANLTWLAMWSADPAQSAEYAAEAISVWETLDPGCAGHREAQRLAAVAAGQLGGRPTTADELSRFVEPLLAWNPGSVEAARVLIPYVHETGADGHRVERALEALDAVRVSGDDTLAESLALRTLAWCQVVENGRFDEAVTTADQALAITAPGAIPRGSAPTNVAIERGDTLMVAALARHEAGDADGARAALEEATSVYRGSRAPADLRSAKLADVAAHANSWGMTEVAMAARPGLPEMDAAEFQAFTQRVLDEAASLDAAAAAAIEAEDDVALIHRLILTDEGEPTDPVERCFLALAACGRARCIYRAQHAGDTPPLAGVAPERGLAALYLLTKGGVCWDLGDRPARLAEAGGQRGTASPAVMAWVGSCGAKLSPGEESAYLLWAASEVARLSGHPELADEYSASSVAMLEQHAPESYALFHMYYALTLGDRSPADRTAWAAKAADQAELVAPGSHEPVRALTRLAQLHRAAQNGEAARAASEQALVALRAMPTEGTWDHCNAAQDLASHWRAMPDPDREEELEAWLRVIKISEDSGLTPPSEKAYLSIAGIYADHRDDKTRALQTVRTYLERVDAEMAGDPQLLERYASAWPEVARHADRDFALEVLDRWVDAATQQAGKRSEAYAEAILAKAVHVAIELDEPKEATGLADEIVVLCDGPEIGSAGLRLTAAVQASRIHELAGDTDRAVELTHAHVDLAHELLGEGAECVRRWSWSANALYRMGRHAEAIELYQRVLELSRDVAPAQRRDHWYWVLALCAGDRGLELFSKHLAAEEAVDPQSVNTAACLHRYGGCLLSTGQPAEALEQWERALDLDPPREFHWSTLRTAAADMHYELGDLSRAAELYEDAWRMRGEDGSAWRHMAQELGRLVEIYAELGDLRLAEERRARMDEVVAAHAPATPEGARTLMDLASTLVDQGDFGIALSHLERAQKTWAAVAPGSLDRAAALAQIADVRRRMGRLDDALQDHIDALVIRREAAPDSELVADSLAGIATVHIARGEFGLAITHLLDAIEIRQEKGPGSPAHADALNSLGYAYARSGRTDEAIESYEESLSIARRTAAGSLTEAYALNNLALAQMQASDWQAAGASLERALQILQSAAPGSAEVGTATKNLGDVLLATGQTAAAEVAYQQAHERLSAVLPGSTDLATVLHAQGAMLLDAGDAVAAESKLAEAVDIVERARVHSAAQTAARSRFSARFDAVYHDLQRALVAQGRAEDAANVAERGRARGFLEELAERGVALQGLPETLAAQQARIDGERNAVYAEMRGLGEGDPDHEALAARLAEVELAQERLAERARAQDPAYALLLYPQPLGIDQLQRTLDPGSMALIYSLDEEESLLYSVMPGAPVEAHPIDLSVAQAEASVAEILAQIARGEDVQASCQRLGASLLGPVADKLEGAQTALIMPDGILWYLPFSVLTAGDRGDPLVDLLSVSYVPSGTALLERRRLSEGVPVGETVLAMGDPDFSALDAALRSDDAATRGMASAFRGVGERLALGRLPYTLVEVLLIEEGSARPVEALTSAMATETAWREKAPEAGVIHLATHGLYDPEVPMESSLVLSFPPDPGPHDDGLLKAWEILRTDLSSCDMVVLSACETARGEEVSGEGILGLTRAFLDAGARSVLCSQWAVSDQSTAALMVRFYHHRDAGLPKAEALRRAMRELRTGQHADGTPLELPADLGARPDEWSHPHYWAPFVLIGDWR
ncbi:MAG: CHAT domain-containing protein [Armatimonadia bacterium]|nr:CHAT domain-containing protein [Armatimonadia bacterium]